MKYSSFRKENQEISRKWASSLLNSFKQISVQTKSLPTFLRDFGSAKCPPGYRSSKWEWSSFQSKAMYWFPSWLTVGKRTPQSLLTHTRCPFNLLSWVISLNQTNSISSSNQWREQITVSASPFCTHQIWIKSTVQIRKNNSRKWKPPFPSKQSPSSSIKTLKSLSKLFFKHQHLKMNFTSFKSCKGIDALFDLDHLPVYGLATSSPSGWLYCIWVFFVQDLVKVGCFWVMIRYNFFNIRGQRVLTDDQSPSSVELQKSMNEEEERKWKNSLTYNFSKLILEIDLLDLFSPETVRASPELFVLVKMKMIYS